MQLSHLYRKALSGDWLQVEEGAYLWQHAPLEELMAVAHMRREELVPGNEVTWQIDRNINLTNICVCRCKFCNFHSGSGQSRKPYVTSRQEYTEKIEELLQLGGDQILLQGGFHPQLTLPYYEELFSWLQSEFPSVAIHALGPPEVVFLAQQSGLSIAKVLERLVAHGLSSLPGAGAEVLSDRVRHIISPRKCRVAEWLEVMRIAHRMGLLTSATMMYGHLETLEERLTHFTQLRTLQEERPTNSVGFCAFIAWPFQQKGTLLAREHTLAEVSPHEHLRLTALARLMLPNIPHIQASWLTIGVETAQLSLWGGADDMGSIMIEEQVVWSAGGRNRLNRQGMETAIREAGFTPVLRDQGYHRRMRPAVWDTVITPTPSASS